MLGTDTKPFTEILIYSEENFISFVVLSMYDKQVENEFCFSSAFSAWLRDRLYEKRAENEQNRHHYFSKSLFYFSKALFKYWNRWVLLRHVSRLSRGCSDKILTNTGIFWALRSSAASNQLFLEVRLFLPS